MAAWLQVLIAICTLLGAGGGIYAIATLPQQRKKLAAGTDQVVASTVEDLLGTARDQIGFLKAELVDARSELAGARRGVAQVRVEAGILEQRLHSLISMIHDPYMTIDRLRVMVPITDNTGKREND